MMLILALVLSSLKILGWQAQLSRDDGQLRCVRGVALKYNMADTGVPNLGKMIATFACENDKSLGRLLQHRKIAQGTCIRYDHTVQSQIDLIHHVDSVVAIPQEEILKRLRVFGILESYLNGLHCTRSVSSNPGTV